MSSAGMKGWRDFTTLWSEPRPQSLGQGQGQGQGDLSPGEETSLLTTRGGARPNNFSPDSNEAPLLDNSYQSGSGTAANNDDDWSDWNDQSWDSTPKTSKNGGGGGGKYKMAAAEKRADDTKNIKKMSKKGSNYEKTRQEDWNEDEEWFEQTSTKPSDKKKSKKEAPTADLLDFGNDWSNDDGWETLDVEKKH